MIAVDCGMPSFLANSLLVSTASLRKRVRNSLLGLLVSLLSMIPVKDTPSNLSSSVFCLHCLRKYLKSVKVDWNVPSIVAALTLANKSFSLSVARITTSVRLQNWYGRKIISEQGLVPKSHSTSLLPFSDALFLAACLLKMPRSPDLESYKLFHSFINTDMSGLEV